MKDVVCEAPAKINLALHVTGRRADGYHLLESLVVFTAFGDRVTARRRAAPGVQLTLSGPFGSDLGALADPCDNLALRAGERVLAHNGGAGGVALTLEKHLPIAAGLGGGSADAAAALRATARLFKVGDEDFLIRAAAELGADVPMCLAGRPLIARGIGDIIEPVPNLPPLHLLLVNPAITVRTPSVFAALERKHNPSLQTFDANADLGEWLIRQRNDLEAPAIGLVPEIATVLSTIAACEDARIARMSGSGATCFGLFSSEEACENAARRIRRQYPGWWVRATVTGGSRLEDGRSATEFSNEVKP